MLTALTTAATSVTASATELVGAWHGPGGGMGPGGPGGGGWGGPGPWWPVFPAVWLLIWAGIITLAIVFFRRRRRWAQSAPRRSAEAVLSERFARGEIDDTEYQHRLETLRMGSTNQKPPKSAD